MAFLSTTTGPLANPQLANPDAMGGSQIQSAPDWWSQQGLNYPTPGSADMGPGAGVTGKIFTQGGGATLPPGTQWKTDPQTGRQYYLPPMPTYSDGQAHPQVMPQPVWKDGGVSPGSATPLTGGTSNYNQDGSPLQQAASQSPYAGAQVSNPDATGGSQIQSQPGQPQMQGLPGQAAPAGGAAPGVAPSGGNLKDPAYAAQVVQYYASQPGANPSLKNDPNYWITKITSGELGSDMSYIVGKFMTPEGAPAGSTGGTGGMGTLSGLADGSLLEPWTKQFQAPDPQQIANDPNYQFQLQQGLRGVQSGAAARGTLLTGGTQKALDQYGQGLASSFGNTLYNRNLGEYQMNQNTFYQNQDRPFTKLSQLATLGKPQTVPVPT